MAKAFSQDWGSRLRRERERRGWSREQLAEKINGAAHSIFRWEDGRDKPRPDMRERLVTVFGKSEDEWGRWIGNVPYLRNLYFTGRESILKRLHAALNGRTIMVVSQRRAISGLGGIGKTQTAVEYAYRYGDKYDLVLWVRADSREALLAQFAGLASLFDLPNQAENDQNRLAKAVKRHLETQEEQVWLLIFDNVDDLQVVKEFLPERGNGAILITTRLHAVGNHMRKIELDKLSLEESMQFLLGRSSAGESQEQPTLPEAERQAAEQLCLLLDGLPLALDQAAAYIEERGCSLAEYVELYQQQRAAFLQRRNQIDPEDYPDSVATTWLLSFQRIEAQYPAAAELLRLCAFLAPDTLPEEMLTAGAAFLGPVLAPVAADSAELNRAIEALQAYSLVKRNPREKALSIHRLVQVVIQDRLEALQARQWAGRAVYLVNCAFPDGTFATWDRCEHLMPHVLVCVDHVKKWQLASAEAGHVFHRAGEYLALRAQYGEALALTQEALSIREQVLGQAHPDVASSLNNVGYIYNELGRHKEALPLYQQAVAIREQTLEPTHPDRTESLNNLAEVHRNLGQYAKALPLYQQALAIREQTLGPNDPNVADSLNNLALLYQAQGQNEQAQQCFQRALMILEQALEPTDPRVAVGLNNLGGIFRVQGQYAEAQQCFQQALAISEQALGPDNFYVAHSLYNLAELYQARGEYAEVLRLFRRALAMLEQGLGPDHPSVAIRLNNLANLHQAQGQYAEALQLYHRALTIREQALGSQHPDTAETMHDLARLCEVQGSHEEARSWYERALAAREFQFGAHHPKTRETRQCLISLLRAMGRDEEAAWLEAVQSGQEPNNED
jgi:tetratricopeptide (TPR) repeat protein/DNA-binding XRE family transcriptional regulator